MLSGLVWARKWMWVKFTQTKTGLPDPYSIAPDSVLSFECYEPAMRRFDPSKERRNRATRLPPVAMPRR